MRSKPFPMVTQTRITASIESRFLSVSEASPLVGYQGSDPWSSIALTPHVPRNCFDALLNVTAPGVNLIVQLCMCLPGVLVPVAFFVLLLAQRFDTFSDLAEPSHEFVAEHVIEQVCGLIFTRGVWTTASSRSRQFLPG